MFTAMLLLTLLIVTLYALQRNHTRQTALWSTLYGSSEFDDRDLERVHDEVTIAATAPGHTATMIRRDTTPQPERRRHAA